jgi:hypothetical protein
MMVTKSSDKSTRMRVLGFAKAVANLEMENDGSMKTAFAATQHSDNKPTKKSTLAIASNSVSAQKDPPGVSPCSIVARNVHH